MFSSSNSSSVSNAPPSVKKSRDKVCYFMVERKSEYELEDRPEISKVKTPCDNEEFKR